MAVKRTGPLTEKEIAEITNNKLISILYLNGARQDDH
jgi:hypothetical protein